MTTTKLSPQQKKLLTTARNMRGSWFESVLVSGHQYRTALSLENRGLGSVRYQGPAQGWFTANA